MDGTPEKLTDREVIDLIMTSQEYQTYTPEDHARAEAQQAALIERYREEKKEWDRKAKLKARKTQGGLRDHWAELIARDGLPPKGLRIIPDSDLPHKVKVNRTLVLKRAEKRRLARMERQRQLAKPTKPEKPWRKSIKTAEDMKAWLAMTSEKMRRDTEEIKRKKAEWLKQIGYVSTPEKEAEIRAHAEILAGISDKHLRNHGYASRTGFMNSADESADFEDRGLCPIMDDHGSDPFGGDD